MGCKKTQRDAESAEEPGEHRMARQSAIKRHRQRNAVSVARQQKALKHGAPLRDAGSPRGALERTKARRNTPRRDKALRRAVGANMAH